MLGKKVIFRLGSVNVERLYESASQMLETVRCCHSRFANMYASQVIDVCVHCDCKLLNFGLDIIERRPDLFTE